MCRLGYGMDNDGQISRNADKGQIVSAFADWALSYGVVEPKNGWKLDATGWSRTGTVDKPTSDKATYKIFTDAPFGGMIQVHGEHSSPVIWRPKLTKDQTFRSADDRKRDRERIEAQRLARQEEQAKIARKAAALASSFVKQFPQASDDHPYLVRKCVPAAPGVKIGQYASVDNCLMIPRVDAGGFVRGMQFIGPDKLCFDGVRDKTYLAGAESRGTFFEIDGDKTGAGRPIVVVAEGYATGMEFGRLGVRTAIAFDASNLFCVVEAMLAKYPDARVFVAADNDVRTESQIARGGGAARNTGLDAAKAIERELGVPYLIPRMIDDDGADLKCDWNDLAGESRDAFLKQFVEQAKAASERWDAFRDGAAPFGPSLDDDIAEESLRDDIPPPEAPPWEEGLDAPGGEPEGQGFDPIFGAHHLSTDKAIFITLDEEDAAALQRIVPAASVMDGTSNVLRMDAITDDCAFPVFTHSDLQGLATWLRARHPNRAIVMVGRAFGYDPDNEARIAFRDVARSIKCKPYEPEPKGALLQNNPVPATLSDMLAADKSIVDKLRGQINKAAKDAIKRSIQIAENEERRANIKEVEIDPMADKTLAIRVLGRDGKGVLTINRRTREMFTITQTDFKSSTNLASFDALDSWAALFPRFGADGLVVANDVDMPKCANTLQRLADMRTFDRKQIRRRGMFWDAGRIVVNTGSCLLVDGIQTDYFAFDDKSTFTYIRNAQSGILFDHTAPALTDADRAEIVDCTKVFWLEYELDRKLALGTVVSSPFNGLLDQRPRIAQGGPSTSGKSVLMGFFCKAMLRPNRWMIYDSGFRSSWVGMVNDMTGEAPLIAIDEFDKAKISLEKVGAIELAQRGCAVGYAGDPAHEYRVAEKDGGNKVRSTCFMLLTATLHAEPDDEQDRNRTALLIWKELPEKQKALWKSYWEPRLNKTLLEDSNLSDRFSVWAVSNARSMIANIDAFREALSPILKAPRLTNTFAPLMAAAYTFQYGRKASDKDAAAYVGLEADWNHHLEVGARKDNDDALRDLLSLTLRVDGGFIRSVGDLVRKIALQHDRSPYKGLKVGDGAESAISDPVTVDNAVTALSAVNIGVYLAGARTETVGDAFIAFAKSGPRIDRMNVATKFGPALIPKVLSDPRVVNSSKVGQHRVGEGGAKVASYGVPLHIILGVPRMLKREEIAVTECPF